MKRLKISTLLLSQMILVTLPTSAFSSDFCALSESGQKSEASAIWNNAVVQNEIKTLAQTKPFCHSPHGAYAFSYLNMTTERDRARCDVKSSMFPKDALDRKLNDALAQLMTSNYVRIVKSCLNPASSSLNISKTDSLDSLWCQLHSDAELQNWDSVRVALGSTSIYLTSHMAVAVSALVHQDSLWIGTPFQSIDGRIKRVQSFKPVYDSFNGFLAKNLTTVSAALKNAGLTKAPLLNFATQIANKIPGGDLAFGNIRDTTFRLGLSLAKAVPVGQHPWLINDASRKNIQKILVSPSSFQNNTDAVDQSLNQITSHAHTVRGLFTLPAIGLLGGKNFFDTFSDNNCAQ